MILEADMVIENAIKYVKQIFADDCSGHDYHHTMKVYRSAIADCTARKSGYVDCAVSSLITRCR